MNFGLIFLLNNNDLSRYKSYHLAHSWGEDESIPSLKAFAWKKMYWMRLEFEHCAPNTHSESLPIKQPVSLLFRAVQFSESVDGSI